MSNTHRSQGTDTGHHCSRRDKERDAMVRQGIQLVNHLADEYVGRCLDYDDLVQEGSLGLIRAVESYLPYYSSEDNEFSEYASSWIRHFMIRAIINRKCLRAYIIHGLAEIEGKAVSCYDMDDRKRTLAKQVDSVLDMLSHEEECSLWEHVERSIEKQVKFGGRSIWEKRAFLALCKAEFRDSEQARELLKEVLESPEEE